IIGGTACDILFDEAGIIFRATKDLDLVLCVESLSSDFIQAFWEFIRNGRYQNRQKSTGKKLFYRFYNPEDNTYPTMIELFSRIPDALDFKGSGFITPIPAEGGIPSLSAILLDDDYYYFLLSGKIVIDGITLLKPEYLIPIKARAWLDLGIFAHPDKKGDFRNFACYAFLK
ncbi:MAG: hypothetical protein ABSG94_12480, partial [Brevinematales bacterium]